MSQQRNITLRRSIQQVIHCLKEAEAVLNNKEDPRCALDDIHQANMLIDDVVTPQIKKLILDAR